MSESIKFIIVGSMVDKILHMIFFLLGLASWISSLFRESSLNGFSDICDKVNNPTERALTFFKTRLYHNWLIFIDLFIQIWALLPRSTMEADLTLFNFEIN